MAAVLKAACMGPWCWLPDPGQIGVEESLRHWLWPFLCCFDDWSSFRFVCIKPVLNWANVSSRT